MRPIDLLSSRYNSIKPKGHDGGSSRWRARPVMAAAILLLMSLAVLLPAMVLAQSANQAPTGLTAVPGDDRGSIQLDWNQSTDTTIEEYEYQVRVKGEAWTDGYVFISISDCCEGDNDNSYLITSGLTDPIGTTYEVRLRTMYTDSNSSPANGPPSDTVEVTTGPAAVTMLAATAGHQSVTLSWTDSGQGVTHYEYRQKKGADAWGDWKDVLPRSIDTESLRVTGLDNGTEYTFQVRAHFNQPASGGDPAIDAVGGAGAEVKVTPGAPAALALDTTVAGYQSIRLAWTDPMDSAITYEYGVAPTLVDDSSTVAWKSASVVKYTNADGDEMVALLVDMTTGTDGADPEVPAEALLDNTGYMLYLRAVNDSGNGPVSEATATTLADDANPATPANLTATPGDESVTLSWDALTDSTDYAGVAFQYCQGATEALSVDDCDWQAIDNSNFTTTSHMVTGLTNGTPYYFRVRAISSADTADTLVRVSDASAEALAVTPGLPSAPTNLKAIPGDAKFELSWTASAANGSAITGYEYNTNDAGWKLIAGSGTSALITKTSATVDTDLTNATYQVRLRAVNGNGESAESEELPVTTSDSPPAPTGLTATPGDGQVSLTWTAPSYLDISGYAYRQDSGATTPVPGSDAKTTSHTVIGLINGTEYDFEVLAMNNELEGTAITTVDNVTPGVPTAPRNLTADSGTPEEITLSWAAPTYAGTPTLTRYEYRYTSVAPDGVPQWPTSLQTGFWAPTTPPGTATELILPAAGADKILEPGTVYHFQVRAVNDLDESAESEPASGIATAVKAGWAFKIETLDGNNVVTSLVAAARRSSCCASPPPTPWIRQTRARSQACGLTLQLRPGLCCPPSRLQPPKKLGLAVG